MQKSGILLFALILAAGATSVSANVNKTYTLKGEAPSGSRIPVIEATSAIPFNASFAALSDAQKELVKSKYDNLSVHDTPPFPHYGLQAIYKPIIKANKSIGAVGTLRIDAVVNKNGVVETVVVRESPHRKLSNKASQALLGIKFDAATCNGEACAMTYPFEIKFQ